MFPRTGESFSKTWLKLLPLTFLMAFGITYLPPKPSVAAYVRVHPDSTFQRVAFAAVVTPIIAGLGAFKLSNSGAAKSADSTKN